MYESLQSYCLFIGYSRSGHSLVGSLIDAHPDAIIAHELDALELVRRGESRERIFDALVDRSQKFTASGREWTGYSYAVKGGWNGLARKLQLIGDKKGGRSTITLAHQPELLDQLRATVGLPLRVVHVVRNPFDNVATMFRRGDGGRDSLAATAKQYAWLCAVNEQLRRALGAELIEVHHEDLVADPRECLTRLMTFLGLSLEEEHLTACSNSVFPVPKRTRHTVEWSREATDILEATIECHDFLARYSFVEADEALPTSFQ